MPIEAATYISQLNASYPDGGDSKSTLDNHDRLIKAVLLASLPNISGAMNASHTELNVLVGITTSSTLGAQLAAKASLAGATFTGLVTFSASAYFGAGATITFEGTTADAYELTINPGEPTADRTQTHQDATGTLALVGVNEQIAAFPAGSMKVSTTSGAGTLAWDESTTYDVMIGYLAFDAATQEYAQFSFRAPAALDESAGFLAMFVWKEAASATAHNCVWQIEMQAQGDGDTIDSAWGTAVTVTDTGSSGTRHVTAATGAITPGGAWAAGDEIICRVSRKSADAADTLDVDAHLIEVVLFATYALSVEP